MAALEHPALAVIGSIENFWAVIGVTVVWALMFSATSPIRQTYINGMIPCDSGRPSSPSTR